MTLKIGENVGPYRVIAQLGQGGMATVYRAYHAALDRYVAIKMLHPAFRDDTSFLGRFQREARVLARLEHPNIVPIYDFAEHEGQPYLVMKFVDGRTLKARLAEGPLSLAEATSVVDAVGAALAYAHKRGILHRDIKPSNVIITPDGHQYLSDFGLARIAEAGESTLSQDTMLGTPNYISPEQARGMKDLDVRTDIYSFGVVLYEIVVGQVPFRGDTPFSVIHDHIYTPLPPPSVVNPHVPPAVERVLLKALAKERGDRYADAPAMVAAFHQAIAEGAPVGALQAAGAGAGGAAAASKGAALAAVPASGAVAAAPTVKGVQPAPKKAGAEEKPKAKRRTWIWVVAGVAALACLCVGALAAVGNAREQGVQLTAAAAASPSASPAHTTAPDATHPPPTPMPGPTKPPDYVAGAETLAASHPDDADARLNLAKAYYKAGRLEDARREFEKAAELAHHDPRVYLEMLPVLENDPIAALSMLLPGLQHNPDNKDLWLSAAVLMDRAAPIEAAEGILRRYVEAFPDRALPKAGLAQYYLVQRQPLKAKQLIDELLRDFPRDPVTHMVNGRFLVARGQKEAAIKEFELVLASPATPEYMRRRAQEEINRLRGTPAP